MKANESKIDILTRIDELKTLLAFYQKTYGASENPLRVIEVDDIKDRLADLETKLE